MIVIVTPITRKSITQLLKSKKKAKLWVLALHRALGAILNVNDEDEFDNDEGPHQFDPVADETYIADYRRDIAETREEERRLMRCFESVEPLESWYVLSRID